MAMFALTLFLHASNNDASSDSKQQRELVPYAQNFWQRLFSAKWQDGGLGPHAELRRVSQSLDRDKHDVVLAPVSNDASGEASFLTDSAKSRHPFRDLLLSWNVDAPAGTGFVVEVRVAPDVKAPWSPWMFVGDWGEVPSIEKSSKCDGGRIDADYFHGDRTFERAQVRVRAFASPAATAHELVVHQLVLCFSDPSLLVDAREDEGRTEPGWLTVTEPQPVEHWKRVLDVPFRSQKAEKPEIAGRICSPTSLAMVLTYRGVDRPTSEVAARAYDATNDIFGNWPDNIQAAYSYGVRGYLTRFTNWASVEAEIRTRQPLILSIAVKEGQLTGAPYTKTAGHLLVLTGFDEHGDCCVNDPAAPDAATGKRVYTRSQMQTVWLDRGGTAYVLGPKR